MYSFLIFLKCRRYFTWSPSLFTNISKNHRKNFHSNNLVGFLVLFIFLQHILLSSNLYECSFIPHRIPNKVDINSTRNNSNNTATINFSTMMTNTTTTTLTITSSTTMANRYYILPTKAVVPTITNSSIILPNPILSLYQNQSSHNSSYSTNNQSIRINISTLVMIPLPATIISTKFSTGKAIYEIKSTSTIISTADAASTLTRVSPNINNLCVNDSSNSNYSPNKSVLCTKKTSLGGDEPSSLAFRPISLDIPPSFIAPAIPLKYVQIHVGYPTALRKGGIDYYKDQERQHERQEKPPTINIGLLLPANCRYLSCLSKVAPAMRIAFRRHKVESLLSGFTINIIQGDTNCSQIEGPLVAIRMIWFEKVVALFGPVCDFAIDSVSIMTSRFFNIPFITAGAFNPEFGRNKKAPDSAYPMLTRVGVPLNSIFPCLVKLFRYYNWSQFFFLYEVNSHPEVINDFGFQVASGITRTLNNYRNYVLSANVPPPNPTKKSKKSDYKPKPTQASFNKSFNSSAYFNSKTTFNYPSPNKSRESTNPFPFFPTHKAADLDQMLRQNLNYANILQEIGTKYSKNNNNNEYEDDWSDPRTNEIAFSIQQQKNESYFDNNNNSKTFSSSGGGGKFKTRPVVKWPLTMKNLSRQMLEEAWDFERQYRNYIKNFESSKRNSPRRFVYGGESFKLDSSPGFRFMNSTSPRLRDMFAYNNAYPYDMGLTHPPEYEAFLVKDTNIYDNNREFGRNYYVTQPSNEHNITFVPPSKNATITQANLIILTKDNILTNSSSLDPLISNNSRIPSSIFLKEPPIRPVTRALIIWQNNISQTSTTFVSSTIASSSISTHENQMMTLMHKEDINRNINPVSFPRNVTVTPADINSVSFLCNFSVTPAAPFNNKTSKTTKLITTTNLPILNLAIQNKYYIAKTVKTATDISSSSASHSQSFDLPNNSFTFATSNVVSNTSTRSSISKSNQFFSTSIADAACRGCDKNVSKIIIKKNENLDNLKISSKNNTVTVRPMETADKKMTMPKPEMFFKQRIVFWGLLLNNNTQSLASLSRIAPAIQVALKRHQVQALLKFPLTRSVPEKRTNFSSPLLLSNETNTAARYAEDYNPDPEPDIMKVVVKQGDSKCSHIYGFTEAMRLVLKENVVVLFGPVCDLAAVKFARLTGRLFNVPMISAGTLTHDFGRNKSLPESEFKLLTRVGPNFNSMAKAVFHTLNNFGWNRLTILYEHNSHPEIMDKFCHYASSGILNEIVEWNTKVDLQQQNNNKSGILREKFVYKIPRDLQNRVNGQTSWDDLLKETVGFEYTVIILCASQSTVRKILLTAYDLNMIQSGEYVFFNIELFNKPDRKIPMWQVDADTAENNAKAKIAYEALFTLTMRMPDNDEYRKFSDQVKEISKRVYGFDYGTENVNAFVSAFHDAVILYALALNETLQAGFNYTDGVEITRRMWNRTFTGITGNVSIDANGDRYTDYSLWDLNPETGRFQVVLNYYGKENSLVEIGGKSIHWAGGRTEPPLDRPRCGYDGSLCKKKEIPNYAIIITFLGCLVIFLSILSFFIYRRYRLEAELGAMKWRIDWNDLMFQSVLQPKDNIKFHSKWSLTRLSLDNDRELDNFSTDTGVSENLMEESETEGTNLDFPNHNSSTYQQEKGKSFSKYCGVTAPYTVCKSRAGYLRLKKRSSQAKKKRLLSKIEPDYFSDRSGSLKNTRLSRSSFATGDHYNESRLSKVSHSLHHHHHHHKKSSDSYHWYGGDFGGKYKKDSYIGTVRIAYYKSVPVILKPVVNKKKIEISRPLLLEIKQRKDLQNDYVTRFVGACLDNVNPRHNCLAMEYCQKGSLRDILENTRLQLDWMFRYSLMHDLTKGMSFLHNSEIRSHGNLKSTNCLVDSRFVLKITDFGLHLLRPNYDAYYRGTPEYYERKLWTAPEILRLSDPPPGGTQKADVYSFAIIMQEIVLRKGTFYIGDVKYSSKDIVQRVKAGYNLVSPNHYFRPTLVGADCEDEVIKLIEKCWSEDPNDRIDFNAVRLIIRKINKENESDNILDNLLSRMEHYANNLENLVEERTADYLEQKRKAEEILYQLLPKSVATQLIHGESVTAESFDSVTIYFSDIVGFTSISACSTPMQVVDLLNDLYTCFDSTIGNFDVYKVETIGDAYMVVSGLPKRINSNEHAKEISSMAIALQKSAGTFTIRHRPFEKLVLRIGIHSGPCVAGVVGLKMPRYCLFGDTVNTASRMESTGKPNMIHISSVTRNLIQPLGIFDLELRGEVDVKGKGTLTTYWLLGYKEKPKDDENGADDDNHIKPDPKTSEEHSKTNKKEESLEITETRIKDELAGDISDFQYKSEIEIPQHKRDPLPISLSEPTSSTTDTPQEQNTLMDTPGSANSEGIQSTESSNYSVTSAFLNSSDLEHSPIERLRKVSAKLLMNDKPLNAFNNNNDDSSNNNRKSMYATPPSSPIMMKRFGTEATNTSPSSPPTTARSSEDESQDSVKPLRSDIRRNARNNAQKKNPLSPQHHSSRSPTSLNKNSERNHAPSTLVVDPLSIIPPEYQAIKFLPLKGSQHHDIVLAATQEAVTEPRGARAITSLFKSKAQHFLSSTLSNLSLPNSFSTTSLSPPGYNCKNRDVDAAAPVFTFNTAPLLTKNKTQTDQGLNHNNKKCNTIHLRKNNTCDSFLFSSQSSKARQSDSNKFNFTSDSSSPNNIGILNQNNATTAKNKAFVGKNPKRNSISADMMMLNEHPHIVMKDISNNQKA